MTLTIFANYITTPLGFIYFFLLCDKWKHKLPTRIGLFATYMVVLFLSDFFVYSHVDSQLLADTLTFGIGIISGALLIYYMQDVGKAVYFYILSNVLVLVFFCENISVALRVLLGLPELLLKIVATLVTAVLVYFHLRNFILYASKKPRQEWTLPIIATFCIFFNFCICRYVIWVSGANSDMMILNLCITFIAVFCYLATNTIFYQRTQEQELREAALASKNQLAILNQQIESTQKSNESLRILRHDLRHYTTLIASFIDTGDYDGARETLNSIDNSLDEYWGARSIHPYTGSTSIDSLLSYYGKQAADQGTEFEVHILELPTEEQIPTSSLSLIFANALENALHAVMKIPISKPRAILIKARPRGEQYFLEIANTYEEDIVFNSATGRPTSYEEGHGYGVESIARLTERNDGVLNFNIDDHWFHLQILL